MIADYLTREIVEEWLEQQGIEDNFPYYCLGMALRDEDGRLICIGGFWIKDWEYIGFISHDGHVPLCVHKYALKLIKLAEEFGVTRLWANTDPNDDNPPNAIKWLQRLGFRRVGRSVDGTPVWRRDLDGGSILNSAYRRWDSAQRGRNPDGGRVRSQGGEV